MIDSHGPLILEKGILHCGIFHETEMEEPLCLPTHLCGDIAISLKKPHVQRKLPLRKSPSIYHADFNVRWVAAKRTASLDRVLNCEQQRACPGH
jgi:hypothetical protein